MTDLGKKYCDYSKMSVGLGVFVSIRIHLLKLTKMLLNI